MTEQWSFADWFNRQHGKRPSTIGIDRLCERIKFKRMELRADEELLARLEEWDGKRTSALYAWNVIDEKKL